MVQRLAKAGSCSVYVFSMVSRVQLNRCELCVTDDLETEQSLLAFIVFNSIGLEVDNVKSHFSVFIPAFILYSFTLRLHAS